MNLHSVYFVLILLNNFNSEIFGSIDSTWIYRDKIDRLSKKILECYTLNGLMISIVQNNETLFLKSYGLQNQSKVHLNTSQSQLLIASISKLFTSILISFLSDYFSFNLDQPINEQLNLTNQIQFMSVKRTQLANFKHLLSHRMAVGRYDALFIYKSISANRLLSILKDIPAKNESQFGNSFLYTNFMYTVAGKLVDRILQQNSNVTYNNQNVSFLDLMQRYILQPLGMKSTRYLRNIHDLQNLARSSINVSGSLKYFQLDIFETASEIAAAAGLLTTLEDLNRFQLFLTATAQSSNYSRQQHLLRLKSALNRTLQPQIEIQQDFTHFINKSQFPNLDEAMPYSLHTTHYCLGWFYAKYRDYEVYWHGGSYFAIESMLLYVPALNSSVFIYTNAIRQQYFSNQYEKVIMILALFVVDLLIPRVVDPVIGSANQFQMNETKVCQLFHLHNQTDIDFMFNTIRIQQNKNPQINYDLRKYHYLIGQYSHNAFGSLVISHYSPIKSNFSLQLQYGELFRGLLYQPVLPCDLNSTYPVYNTSQYKYLSFDLYMQGAYWFIKKSIFDRNCDVTFRINLQNHSDISVKTFLHLHEMMQFQKKASMSYRYNDDCWALSLLVLLYCYKIF